MVYYLHKITMTNPNDQLAKR